VQCCEQSALTATCLVTLVPAICHYLSSEDEGCGGSATASLRRDDGGFVQGMSKPRGRANISLPGVESQKWGEGVDVLPSRPFVTGVLGEPRSCQVLFGGDVLFFRPMPGPISGPSPMGVGEGRGPEEPSTSWWFVCLRGRRPVNLLREDEDPLCPSLAPPEGERAQG
jgi:hypothetical protein